MPLLPLIEHLQTEPQAALVATMQRAIGGSTDQGPCVYFAASYERLARIAESGEILPRNAVHDLTSEDEISATAVQTRREGIYLGNGNRQCPPKQVHDCLNLFFNPHNSSVFALSRNQIIVGGFPLQFGIIEIPLARISEVLRLRGGLWACTKKNVAAGGFSCGILEELSGEEWPWPEIFDCSDEGQQDQPRAAEFLLWLENDGSSCSSGLPIDVISRVLLPDASPLVALNAAPRSQFLKFADSASYLHQEEAIHRFESHQRFNLGQCSETFSEAAAKLPVSLGPTLFVNPQIAVSRIHGIPHVARVMLWAHYLSQPVFLLHVLPRIGQFSHLPLDPHSISDDHLREFCVQARKLAQDSLLAALLHDLRRETNEEDSHHGEDAANHFSDTITAFCDGDQAREERLKEAITWHCRDDDGCPDRTNHVWMILKDADALDRGRFSVPCDGTDFQGTGCNNDYCSNHSGCAYPTLRLNYEGIQSHCADWPFRRNLALVARNLAKATATSPWCFDDPVSFLVRWLNLGQERVGEL